MQSHGEPKKALQPRVNELRRKISEWAHSGKVDGFDWQVEFAEVFAPQLAAGTLSGKMAGIVNMAGGQMELTDLPRSGGFDILLANPPYVRADAQFKHIQDEAERQKEIAKWKSTRDQLKKSKTYKTLYEKWDLYIPFLERAYQLLRPKGQMVFIVSDAYNAAKYAQKSHEFFLQNSRVMRIDFCSDINLFDAGVNNTIVHFEKNVPVGNQHPVRMRRWGKRDEFDVNQNIISSLPQREFGESLFRIDGDKKEAALQKFERLDSICYISVGMVIHADEKKAQGLFKADDLVSEYRDKIHPKPYVEGKDVMRWGIQKIRYLEYSTDRAPSLFRRPTFIELHEAPERLLAVRMSGSNIAVAYDKQKLFSNHTVIIVVPWHLLIGVMNKSIRKSASYKRQNPQGDRENREKLAKEYNLKYVLAILNSSFAKEFLNKIRQSKTDIYPDEWKQLPIAPLSLKAQQPFVEKVDAILGEFARYGYPMPPESARKVKDLEHELDRMVDNLYKAV